MSQVLRCSVDFEPGFSDSLTGRNWRGAWKDGGVNTHLPIQEYPLGSVYCVGPIAFNTTEAAQQISLR